MRFEYNFCAGVLREIFLVCGGKRWLAFGDSFCTWVDDEILLAGFVIWILEIIIKIKIRILCEKIHKTSIIFQVIDSGSLIRITLLVFVMFKTGSEETVGRAESEVRANYLQMRMFWEIAWVVEFVKVILWVVSLWRKVGRFVLES